MAEGFWSTNFGGDVTRGLRDLDRDVRASKKRLIMAGLNILRNQAVEELSHPGTGRIRRARTKRVGKLGRKGSRTNIFRAGRASAPGEPPAPDYGALRGSMQVEYDDSAQKGRMGTNIKYAAPLNYGTARAGRGNRTVILPRPFMEPALRKAQVAMAVAGIRELQLTLRTRRQR
jgi:hypothetical protein